MIINHDEIKWNRFLKTTGRLSPSVHHKNISSNSSSNINTKKIVTAKHKNEVDDRNGVNGGGVYKSERPKSVKDLTKLELYKYALSVAERLNHNFMKSKLDERIQQLQCNMDDDDFYNRDRNSNDYESSNTINNRNTGDINMNDFNTPLSTVANLAIGLVDESTII